MVDFYTLDAFPFSATKSGEYAVVQSILNALLCLQRSHIAISKVVGGAVSQLSGPNAIATVELRLLGDLRPSQF